MYYLIGHSERFEAKLLLLYEVSLPCIPKVVLRFRQGISYRGKTLNHVSLSVGRNEHGYSLGMIWQPGCRGAIVKVYMGTVVLSYQSPYLVDVHVYLGIDKSYTICRQYTCMPLTST